MLPDNNNIQGRRLWTRDEFILTLSLYFQLPFGKLHHRTKEIIELAVLIGRSANSVAMRLCNFAACDPYIINSGRTGLPNGMAVCLPYWNEFYGRKEALFLEAEEIRARYLNTDILHLLPQYQQEESLNYLGEDKVRYVKTRLNQNIFRNSILANYENKCAITGINIPDLLVASHIIPWSEDKEHRLDPSNGLCLSALYDKAFDRGLIAIDPDDYTIVLSNELKTYSHEDFYSIHFKNIERQKIIRPIEYQPNPDYLRYHVENIFSLHN